MNKFDREKYYITTAIAYASRKPHFGNTYEVIATDAIARYKRAMGYDVFFCTGTDEHGQKIEDLAKEQGITPQKYVDVVAGEIKGVWDKMHTSYDYFIRTTDDYHVKTVQKIFEKFLGKNFLTLKVFYIFIGKFQVLYVLNDLLKSCGNGKSATVRHLSEEQIEVRYFVALIELKISVGHSQLIEVA